MAPLSVKSFMRDIQRHELIVLRDDGVYRHILVKAPGTSCMHFNIVTFPGYLVYTGDMGAYTFTRIRDMFEFFRPRKRGFGGINPQYWAEKLTATNCHGEHCSYGAAEWSDDRFKEVIKERFEEHFAELYPGKDADEQERINFEAMKVDAWEQVEDDFFGSDDLQHEGFRIASDFLHEESGLTFPELWNHRFTEYSHSFLWACYAITWAIEKFDQRPEVPAAITWARDSEGSPVEVKHG